MKRAILVLLILAAAAGTAAADSQWDITLNVPYYFGLRAEGGQAGEGRRAAEAGVDGDELALLRLEVHQVP